MELQLIIEHSHVRPVRDARRIAIVLAGWLMFAMTPSLMAASYDEAVAHFRSGDYQLAATVARAEVERGIWSSRWSQLLIECQLTTGQIDDALATYQAAIKRYPTSLGLRYLGIDVLRQRGMAELADVAEADFFTQLQRSMRGYLSREDTVAAGRYLAERGEDARKVLQLFFDRVRERDPDFLPAYLATAELALRKGDFGVAAETMNEAMRLDVADPEIHYLRSRALAASDPAAAAEALNRAIEINANHAPSLRQMARMAIDQEREDDAERLLRRVLAINLHDADAWAMMSVIAHLRGHYGSEAIRRAAALSTWSRNPWVDHRIGEMLSKKYRFAEGAAAQQRALEMRPGFPEAQFQLSQDLLRLGDDKIGWELAEQTGNEDPYNVVAYNLLTLRDQMRTYASISRDNVTVKMDSRESEVFGDAVLDLLCDAKQSLAAKYQVTLADPIVVEIFARQEDFAIRTFGLPGGAGYLGVCFGNVVTANSPSSQGPRPSNWQSVLWHEFAHVVTLNKTRNRMPRWLSEGISVYEERLKDAAWGETMTPRYRQMILQNDFTPIHQLSASFLRPKSSTHLMLAYYQSSLAVQYLIESYGFDALLAILDDLASGLSMSDALIRHTGSPTRLESQYRDYVLDVANSFGAAARWSSDDRSPLRLDQVPAVDDLDGLRGFVRLHPTHYGGLSRFADALIAAERWDEAADVLQRMRTLGVMPARRDGWLEKLATVHQKRGDESAERDVLREIARRCPDGLPALTRLIELASEEENWDDVYRWAEKALTIQPMRSDLYASLAESASQTGRHEQAVQGWHGVLSLEPIDRVGVQFQYAQALADAGDVQAAKNEVMDVLAVTPRFRDAHRLLLSLVEMERENAE